MSEEEASSGTDVWDRPLGMTIPGGTGLIEVIHPSEFWPQNGGIGVPPREMKVWAVKKVRDIEWVLERHPELEGKIHPEEPQELLKTHPLMSDRPFYGYLSGYEHDMYTHHVSVCDVHVFPMDLDGLEDGRIMTVIKDQVITNGPMMAQRDGIEGPVKVSQVKYAVARNRRIPGMFWGRTPVDDAVLDNRMVNEIDAMISDLRRRGVPWIAVPPGTEVDFRSDSAGSWRMVDLDPPADRPNWNPRDWTMNANPATGNAYLQEREMRVNSIRDKLGPQQFELGQNPTGVTNATQLTVIAEESKEKRGPAERALVQLYETLWEHYVKAKWAFQRDDRRVEKAIGATFDVTSYNGTDLSDGIKVEVEAEPTKKEGVFQAAAVSEAIKAGYYGDPRSFDQVTRERTSRSDEPAEADAGGIHPSDPGERSLGAVREGPEDLCLRRDGSGRSDLVQDPRKRVAERRRPGDSGAGGLGQRDPAALPRPVGAETGPGSSGRRESQGGVRGIPSRAVAGHL